MPKICITFPNDEMDFRALGFLAGRANFTTYSNGEMIVESSALEMLACEGIQFTVHGPATYSQTVPVLRMKELGLWPDESKSG
jgi:hypothetical protein